MYIRSAIPIMIEQHPGSYLKRPHTIQHQDITKIALHQSIAREIAHLYLQIGFVKMKNYQFDLLMITKHFSQVSIYIHLA